MSRGSLFIVKKECSPKADIWVISVVSIYTSMEPQHSASHLDRTRHTTKRFAGADGCSFTPADPNRSVNLATRLILLESIGIQLRELEIRDCCSMDVGSFDKSTMLYRRPLGLNPPLLQRASSTDSYVGFPFFLLFSFRINELHARYTEGLRIFVRAQLCRPISYSMSKYFLLAFPPATIRPRADTLPASLLLLFCFNSIKQSLKMDCLFQLRLRYDSPINACTNMSTVDRAI